MIARIRLLLCRPPLPLTVRIRRQLRRLHCWFRGHPVERLNIVIAQINRGNAFSASVVCGRCGRGFMLINGNDRR